MLKDIKLIMDFIKNISTCIYEKEVIFYDEDVNKWYSRIHCDYLSLEEVLEWLEVDIMLLKK